MLLVLTALTLLAALLAAGLALAATRTRALAPELAARLDRLEAETQRGPVALREELRALREELHGHFSRHAQAHETRFSSFSREVGEGHSRLGQVFKDANDAFAHTQTTRLGETNTQMRDLRERLEAQGQRAEAAQKAGLDAVAAKVEAMTLADAARQEKLRETLSVSLEQLRRENEAKLEQMRATVDEKLQGTLEKRLGESFQIVSDRLELVHKGLGEMQTLATGVGDLKRVLTNVKSRGGWGEVQLGMLLEDMLTPDQFATNVAVQPGSAERVEYAVRLPGKADGEPVWLPVDAKFPHEDYDRLLAAQEAGLAEEIERAALALEKAVRLQARTICGKYVHPPHSTDFAIMYLPPEGLFAEVIRRPGLMVELQQSHRVMVTGPTTLAAILNSLQMGFRSVAIEKRSSEVWQVLGAAKAEFQNYSRVWDKLEKQLATAQNTVAEAGRKTKTLERKLRSVETVALPEAEATLLALSSAPDAEEEAA